MHALAGLEKAIDRLVVGLRGLSDLLLGHLNGDVDRLGRRSGDVFGVPGNRQLINTLEVRKRDSLLSRATSAALPRSTASRSRALSEHVGPKANGARVRRVSAMKSARSSSDAAHKIRDLGLNGLALHPLLDLDILLDLRANLAEASLVLPLLLVLCILRTDAHQRVEDDVAAASAAVITTFVLLYRGSLLVADNLLLNRSHNLRVFKLKL